MSGSNQHFVSQFYLKGFTAFSGDKVLWQYEKGKASPKRKPTWAVASEDEFYSRINRDGSRDDSIDEELQRVENETAPHLKSLANGSEPKGRSHRLIANFIGLMFLRVAMVRDHAETEKKKFETAEGSMRFINRERPFLEERYPKEIVDSLINQIDERGYGVPIPKNFHLVRLIERANAFGERLCKLHWTLCKAVKGCFFVTSDNPTFCRRWNNLLDPGILGFEREDLGAELGFPISGRRFLLAKPAVMPGFSSIRVPKMRVLELNRRTVLSAHRFVYLPERCSTIVNLMAEHGGFELQRPEIPN